MSDAPNYEELLKRLVLAYDANEHLEHIAAMRSARLALGFILADREEDAADIAVLLANGYTAEGKPNA
jgi:hypothetical protein